MKVSVVGKLLPAVPSSASVHIVTRWKAVEVAAGVSDLEVFDVVNARQGAQLSLLDNLHAKLYLSDEEGLVGSANLTSAALGWAARSNVEVLVPCSRGDREIQALMRHLDQAYPATAEIRSTIAATAREKEVEPLDEGQEAGPGSTEPWLPRCAVPDKLYAAYADPTTMLTIADAREDAASDIADLGVPAGLSKAAFYATVQGSLRDMGVFAAALRQIPAGMMTDEKGRSLVASARPDHEPMDIADQWRIVRDWIVEFFPEYEAAPTSFVTRLKPKR